MRRILTLLMLLVGMAAQAQTYTIIHSIGKIYEAKSGKYLTKGMRIDESAELKFESEGAKAAVLSSKRGRFVIQKQAAASSKSELSYALSSVLSPARGRLSTRAGGINNQLDFQKKFGEGPVAILGGKYRVGISPTAYPMNDSKFFYASYTYGGEPINKKLTNDGDTLQFVASSLYSIDDKSIDPMDVSDVKLYYFDATTTESTLVTNLDLAVVTRSDLKSMVGLLDDLEGEEKETALVEIINSLYGQCSKKYVQWALTTIYE